MTLQRLGMIGCGSIADLVLTTLARELPAPLAQISLLVSKRSRDQAQALLDRLGDGFAMSRVVHTSLETFLADAPEAVAECASHVAIRDHGPAILQAGCDFIVISIGALADDDFRVRLIESARAGGARLVLPPGAVGGIDALSAARLSGLESVIYSGSKPPRAWRGTLAETLLDLDALTQPTVFFEGSARVAAQTYPFNANVAATLALAGLGFDATQVRLIADPTITNNVHEFTARSACGSISIRMDGQASPGNPKTSLMAGYSVARELLNRAGAVVI